MVPVGSSCFTVPDRSGPDGAGPGQDVVVVWLRGEHDISTHGALCVTLACAIALDPARLVVDLSEVRFMAASTLRAIVRAREFRRLRSQSLVVRSPSACARRVIETCGLGDLVRPERLNGEPGHALGSWVEVPATAPGGDGQVASLVLADTGARGATPDASAHLTRDALR